jgi:hypothetical protein
VTRILEPPASRVSSKTQTLNLTCAVGYGEGGWFFGVSTVVGEEILHKSINISTPTAKSAVQGSDASYYTAGFSLCQWGQAKEGERQACAVDWRLLLSSGVLVTWMTPKYERRLRVGDMPKM